MDTQPCPPDQDHAAPSTFEEMLLVRYERLALKALDFAERAMDQATAAEAQAGQMLTKAVWAHQTLIALRARLLAGEIDLPSARRTPQPARQPTPAGTEPDPIAAHAILPADPPGPQPCVEEAGAIGSAILPTPDEIDAMIDAALAKGTLDRFLEAAMTEVQEPARTAAPP